MQLKTKGIVLQAIKYSETSVIVKIYTERLGLVSYIVKGVRSSKSKNKAAMLQPLTLLDMEVTHRENKQLQYIREFSRAYTYQSIPFHTLKSSVALFLLEVISKSVREHEQNEYLFEFLFESLCALDREPGFNPDFHLIFLLQFTGFIGFMPQGNFTEENPFFNMAEGIFTAREDSFNCLNQADSRLLGKLINANLFDGTHLKITRTERKKLMKNLLKYYQLHIENFSLRSPEILEAVLE